MHTTYLLLATCYLLLATRYLVLKPAEDDEQQLLIACCLVPTALPTTHLVQVDLGHGEDLGAGVVPGG